MCIDFFVIKSFLIPVKCALTSISSEVDEIFKEKNTTTSIKNINLKICSTYFVWKELFEQRLCVFSNKVEPVIFFEVCNLFYLLLFPIEKTNCFDFNSRNLYYIY